MFSPYHFLNTVPSQWVIFHFFLYTIYNALLLGYLFLNQKTYFCITLPFIYVPLIILLSNNSNYLSRNVVKEYIIIVY